MLLRLSSKGQLVLPKPMREKLRLKTGDQVLARIVNETIVLEPAPVDVIKRLSGILAGTNALQELEEEHRREVENDRKLCA